ncbi:MAG TPA: ATP-binding protein [Kofleriaceae bacterium]|nr:ATP-binding protein [Kofleriaceae bacterium]
MTLSVDPPSMKHRDIDGVGLGLVATMDLLPVGVAHFAPDGTFLFVNEALSEILGFTRQELLTKSFQQISFPDDLHECLRLNAELATGAIPRYVHEKRFIRGDGSIVWVRVTVTAARNRPAPAVAFFVAVAEDITAQHLAEEARRTAEARLQLALRAADIGIFRWDLVADRLEADENLLQLFALARDESTKTQAFLSRIHPDDRPRLEEATARSMHGAEIDEEFRIILPDGTERWIRDRARTLLADDGSPICVTGACADVTARRQLDQTVRHALQTAERAVSARDEAIAILAHDLRNPLGNISLASAEVPSDEAARVRRFAIIRRAAIAMERLISDLLDIARIDAGTFAVEKAPTDIRSLLDETVELFAEPAANAGVQLRCTVDDGVPSSALADRERLRQVLSNLVGNALKFTPRGRHVHIGASADNAGGVLFTVRDEGCGIPSEQLAHVFDRFWQANRGKRSGAGLGLAIVKGIIDAHGGSLALESEVGAGTKVMFSVESRG